MSHTTDIISEIYPLVHPEIQKDIDKYIKNEYKLERINDIFRNMVYYRSISFNVYLYYSKSSDIKYSLYEGGLGMGCFIHIYYTINKGYSIEFSESQGYHTIYYVSNDWLIIKDKIDKYFESIMPKDYILKCAMPFTQIYKKELIQAALLRA